MNGIFGMNMSFAEYCKKLGILQDSANMIENKVDKKILASEAIEKANKIIQFDKMRKRKDVVIEN